MGKEMSNVNLLSYRSQRLRIRFRNERGQTVIKDYKAGGSTGREKGNKPAAFKEPQQSRRSTTKDGKRHLFQIPGGRVEKD